MSSSTERYTIDVFLVDAPLVVRHTCSSCSLRRSASDRRNVVAMIDFDRHLESAHHHLPLAAVVVLRHAPLQQPWNCKVTEFVTRRFLDKFVGVFEQQDRVERHAIRVYIDHPCCCASQVKINRWALHLNSKLTKRLTNEIIDSLVKSQHQLNVFQGYSSSFGYPASLRLVVPCTTRYLLAILTYFAGPLSRNGMHFIGFFPWREGVYSHITQK